MNPIGIKNTVVSTAALVILLFLPVSPRAAPSLTLTEALNIAISNNPDLKIASVSRQSAEVEASKLKDGFLPTLSAGLSGTEYLAGDEENETYRTANAGITARYNLYDGGINASSLEGAKRESSAAGLDYRQAEQDLFRGVAAAYLDVISGSEILGVKEQDLEGARTQLDRIQALYGAGARPVTDVYQQQSAVKEAELAIISARRDLETSRMQLMVELGLDEDPVWSVTDPALQDGEVKVVSSDLEEMFQTAMAHRSDIAAQKERIEAAKEGISQTRAGKSLTVDLFGSISAGYSSLRKGDFWEQMGADEVSAAVGVDLTLPLFDARQTSHEVRQAELNLVSEETKLNRLRQQVRMELGQALEDCQMAVKTLEVSQARLLWAEKALESVNARYGAGAATLLELNDARSEESQARYDVVKARYDCLMKAFDSAYFQGQIETTIKDVLEGGTAS